MGDREEMIQTLRREGIQDERVLDAMSRVPRDAFVGPDLRALAYQNEALPIPEGQTISQPFVVALMSAALELQGHECVLDVGTGSGYQAAILALLARRVVGVERHAGLAHEAAQRLHSLGYANVEVHVAGEALGWPQGAPYDGILCAAGAPRVPDALLAQLVRGPRSRLVIPVGTRAEQELMVVHYTDRGFAERRLAPVRFVPLIAPDAWPE